MAQEKAIMGLDIGTQKIRAVVGKLLDNDKLEILTAVEVPSDGIVRASITNIAKAAQALEVIKAKATASVNTPIELVNINISGLRTQSTLHRNSITRTSAKGEITVENVKRLNDDVCRAASTTGHEIVDIIPVEYSVDKEEGIKDPIGMSGVCLGGIFNVVSAPVNVINNTYECAKRAGLKVNNLIFSPLAASLSVLAEEEKQAGVCLVEIGASMMGIAIYHSGSLQHLATIPFGGDVVTNDLAQAFMLMEKQAEQLKIKFGTAYEDEHKNEIVAISGLRNRPAKEIALPIIHRVIEARMEENIQFIRKEIHKSGFRDRLPGGIVLTGGGAQLSCIDRLFSYVTNYDTRLGYPYEFLAGKNENDFPPIGYATAIGLALAYYGELNNSDKYYRWTRNQNTPLKEEPKKEQSGFWKAIKSIF